jgi:hypothetical protein
MIPQTTEHDVDGGKLKEHECIYDGTADEQVAM